MKTRSFDVISIFVVSVALRVWAIAIPLNSDEAKWLSRGANFINSLLAGDLAGTYGSPHPGVPNMWITGIGMALNCQLSRWFPDWLGSNQPSQLGACTETLPFAASLYVLPRLLQAGITAACMVGLYLLTRRLLGRAIALFSIILIILEPFFLAYQRFVTTDAIQSDFSVLAILLMVIYLRGEQNGAMGHHQNEGDRRWLVASGICLGLATASKMIGLFVIPGIVLWMALTEASITNFPKRGWRRQIVDCLRWAATALVTFIAIYPVMWIQPSYTVIRIVNGLLDESARGDFFFLGDPTDSPGLLFYPVVLAFRLSPVMQMGLILYLCIALFPQIGRKTGQTGGQANAPQIGSDMGTDIQSGLSSPLSRRSELLALGLSALCILGILSAAQTKIDRYVTFVLPILAILAAAGWVALLNTIRLRSSSVAPMMHPKRITIGAIALAIGQFMILLPEFPYFITYYNPLLGGAAVARDVLMIGQGEGLDRAARWLNQLPNSDQLTVASWHRSVLAAYFRGRAIRVPKYNEPDDEFWLATHYVVFYVNQLQRSLPDPDIIRYFAAQPPLYTVSIHGVDHAIIYPGPIPTASDLAQIDVPMVQSVGDRARLLGYDMNLLDGAEVAIALYWEFLQKPPPNTAVQITVSDAQGHQVQQVAPLLGGNLPRRKIMPNTTIRDLHRIALSPDMVSDADPRQYQIHVDWISRSRSS
ncbi:MAG: glycosyltransferase family 39 protein [Elainellaceae cyanobacterium]